MSVLFLPEVSRQFVELTEVHTAIEYSESLFHEIQSELPIKVHRKAPDWFVFFNVYEVGGETIYLVRQLSNNHVVAQYLDDIN